MKYLGWLVLGLVLGAIAMWAYDHRDLIANRQKLSGAEKVLSGLQGIFA